MFTDSRPRPLIANPPPIAWPVLLGLAAARLALHFLIGNGYGFHQDEFYYLACGARPDWGYVDQPPLVPLLARLAAEIWGYTTITPGELHVFSALGSTGTIILAGLMARELGGGRFAQGLAAVTVWCAPLFLASGEMFMTVVFDQLCWALAGWLVLRAWQRAPGAGWLLVGLAAGVGLEVKNTMGLFGLGLAVALILTATGRRHLRTPWPWLGGVLALGIFAPNLLWQHTHGWPTAEFVHNNNVRMRAEWTLPRYLLQQLEFAGLGGLVLAAVGLRRAFSASGMNNGAVAMWWVYLTAFVVLLITRGKPYYLGPAYPGVIAAGAVVAEAWTARRLAQSPDGRRPWLRPALVAGVMLAALPIAPAVLPLVPQARLNGWWGWTLRVNHEPAEMIGWPEFAAQVDGVFQGLSPEEQAHTAVQTVSYGRAGALEHFAHLPMPPVCGHNNYWLWGPGAREPQTVIVAGARQRQWMDEAYEQVERVATVDNPFGIDNETRGAGIWICRRPRTSLHAQWEGLKSFQ